MKISFVVPVWKTEKFLDRCLRSITKEQKYDNTEVVVVLDGPSPEGERIAKTYGAKILSQDHKGAPAARNRGFQETTGEIVAFWDSDCYAVPGIVRRWTMAFKAFPDAAFFFGGYRFEGGDGLQGHFPDMEDFDPYVLTTANICSTMSPMRRDFFPGFDENLKRFQDWDLFLTITRRGGKGYHLQGIHFSTELQDEISISGPKSFPMIDAYRIIRQKHGFAHRTIRVCSFADPYRALAVAKMLDADFENNPGRVAGCGHKMVYMLGFYPQDAHLHAISLMGTPGEDVVRAIHWLGTDALQMISLPFAQVEELSQTLNSRVQHHFCETVAVKRILEKVWLRPKIAYIPAEVPAEMPPKSPKPSILFEGVLAQELGESLKRSLPDIEFEPRRGRVEMDKYTGIVRMAPVSFLDPLVVSFLLHGRRAASTIECPYFGYFDPDQPPDRVKALLVKKIREMARQNGAPNHAARKYYMRIFGDGNPQKHILSLLPGRTAGGA